MSSVRYVQLLAIYAREHIHFTWRFKVASQYKKLVMPLRQVSEAKI